MSKDHYLPRLIIRNFTDSSGRIYFFSKKDKKIYGPFDHYTQLQENNFYSKSSINELKEIFPHIELNPIFQDENLDLDKNIGLYLEDPIGGLFSGIIKELLNGNLPKVSGEESSLIKEYFVIQKLRTPWQKRISQKVHNETLKLPPDIKSILLENEHNREIDLKKLIKEYHSDLNHNKRREKLRQFNKELKKNPNFIKDILNSKETEKILEEEIAKSEEELERIRTHPDKHSSEILDLKLRDNFSKETDLDNRRIVYLINKTQIPFNLPDTGVMMTCWDYGNRQELHLYLPIHPQILIEFSCSSEPIQLVDEKFIMEINRLGMGDSLINTYSSDPKSLMF
jgi:hypothetical protein